VIDNIMVCRIGATELAAASLANSFVFIALATGVGFSTAITPLIAATDAERNDKEGQRIFLNGLIVCTFLGVILFSVLFSLKPLINVMEQPEEVTRMRSEERRVGKECRVQLWMFRYNKQGLDS